ncbi:hypothetical protein FRX31_022904 [Thalictrum thalictroides]|uniref:Uncharacterized protein n=1 Tax=Thalictrum thalictroides TaxID=46969 RepID=A0A7J6VSG6_THATH|nr:hypothetical protein FRX31_022904 [Thalictrum thalictroides]
MEIKNTRPNVMLGTGLFGDFSPIVSHVHAVMLVSALRPSPNSSESEYLTNLQLKLENYISY